MTAQVRGDHVEKSFKYQSMEETKKPKANDVTTSVALVAKHTFQENVNWLRDNYPKNTNICIKAWLDSTRPSMNNPGFFINSEPVPRWSYESITSDNLSSLKENDDVTATQYFTGDYKAGVLLEMLRNKLSKA